MHPNSFDYVLIDVTPISCIETYGEEETSRNSRGKSRYSPENQQLEISKAGISFFCGGPFVDSMFVFGGVKEICGK